MYMWWEKIKEALVIRAVHRTIVRPAIYNFTYPAALCGRRRRRRREVAKSSLSQMKLEFLSQSYYLLLLLFFFLRLKVFMKIINDDGFML